MHQSRDVPLQEAAQHLVCFDSKHLRWRLVQDEDELKWRQFLFDRTRNKPAGSLFNHLPHERLEELVRHMRISESMDIFLHADMTRESSAVQAWRGSCAAIQCCPDCAQLYRQLLEARSCYDAREQLDWDLWPGLWYLDPLNIFFTHRKKRARFRNNRRLDQALKELCREPRRREKYPPLHVLQFHGRHYSVNNRRLYCFRALQEQLPRENLDIQVEIHALAGRGNIFKADRSFLLKFFDAFDSANRGESVEFYD